MFYYRKRIRLAACRGLRNLRLCPRPGSFGVKFALLSASCSSRCGRRHNGLPGSWDFSRSWGHPGSSWSVGCPFIIHQPFSGGGWSMTPTRQRYSYRALASQRRAAFSLWSSRSRCRSGGHARRGRPRPTARHAGLLHLRSARRSLWGRMASFLVDSVAITFGIMDRSMCFALHRPVQARASASSSRPF